MNPKRIDDLLQQLSTAHLPSAPTPHQVLRSVRKLRDSGSAPEKISTWLGIPQLSAAMAAVALLCGLAGGILAVSSSGHAETVARLRDSLKLEVFDANSSLLPHETLVSR